MQTWKMKLIQIPTPSVPMYWYSFFKMFILQYFCLSCYMFTTFNICFFSSLQQTSWVSYVEHTNLFMKALNICLIIIWLLFGQHQIIAIVVAILQLFWSLQMLKTEKRNFSVLCQILRELCPWEMPHHTFFNCIVMLQALKLGFNLT